MKELPGPEQEPQQEPQQVPGPVLLFWMNLEGAPRPAWQLS
jgi:hypothetical protein